MTQISAITPVYFRRDAVARQPVRSQARQAYRRRDPQIIDAVLLPQAPALAPRENVAATFMCGMAFGGFCAAIGLLAIFSF